jgi:hypothetical protein
MITVINLPKLTKYSKSFRLFCHRGDYIWSRVIYIYLVIGYVSTLSRGYVFLLLVTRFVFVYDHGGCLYLIKEVYLYQTDSLYTGHYDMFTPPPDEVFIRGQWDHMHHHGQQQLLSFKLNAKHLWYILITIHVGVISSHKNVYILNQIIYYGKTLRARPRFVSKISCQLMFTWWGQ